MTARSTARARWNGALADGQGTVTTDSPALDGASITWKARTGGEAGTTPEELLAAGHAACFSMALTGALAKADHAPEQLDVTATYTFGPSDDGFAISSIELAVEATVPGIEEDAFLEFADGAKVGCPVSKALSVPISLDARLLQTA
ncbi:MAG: osmC [Thermoleophilia bacterium]|nr:osmC [Thermoleophilia bacterium]